MDDLKRLLTKELTVQLWPTAARALGLKRGATYAAATRGEIETMRFGRLERVTTAWLRKKLGLDGTAA